MKGGERSGRSFCPPQGGHRGDHDKKQDGQNTSTSAAAPPPPNTQTKRPKLNKKSILLAAGHGAGRRGADCDATGGGTPGGRTIAEGAWRPERLNKINYFCSIWAAGIRVGRRVRRCGSTAALPFYRPPPKAGRRHAAPRPKRGAGPPRKDGNTASRRPDQEELSFSRFSGSSAQLHGGGVGPPPPRSPYSI